MATKSFLTLEQLARADKILEAPARRPDGDERRQDDFHSRKFSAWLGKTLLAKLEAHPAWKASLPIAVGSWSRGELCPKSDIDMLFAGDEESVKRLTGDLNRAGLKIRARVPLDPADWQAGVEVFDVLAYRDGIPLVTEVAAPLHEQIAKLESSIKAFRKGALGAMKIERAARAKRYDSISNFLEPNLKYGPGGLRDLEQALATRKLFPEKFVSGDDLHAFKVLNYYKEFFLLIRQKLHLSVGGGDVLSANEQAPLARWLGFATAQDFMREIQKGVSRVSFYADWIFAYARAAPGAIEALRKVRIGEPIEILKALRNDPSILMQHEVRLAADRVFAKAPKSGEGKRRLDREYGKQLTAILDPASPEEPLTALVRSRVIDKCVPDFRKIVGYVQHDQYHRFSADAHILQILRELKRLKRNAKIAGRLAPIVKQLKSKDWDLLAFAGLYHDLAKGRGGDHAVKGVLLAQRDLRRFAKPHSFVREVSWLVEEHLLLSAAAFRENPRSPRTWRNLKENGVDSGRLRRLAVFTIADIRATNPDAWTPWKERLLSELIDQLERPETNHLVSFARAISKSKLAGAERFLETLDPFLINGLSARLLVDDVERAAGATVNLEPRILRGRGANDMWIRFHAREDRAGLFLSYVSVLAKLGLSVRHASVLTDSALGVYDWFEVRTTKSPSQVQKLLSLTESSESELKAVRFDTIDLVTEDRKEWVISFRGRDQAGALANAARALYSSGALIKWAKVHTWGRQMDDVFGIAPIGGSGGDAFLERLKIELGELS